MKRGSFLKRALGVILGAKLAGSLPPGGPAATPVGIADYGVIRDTLASRHSLTASGGLCAPLTPYYDLPTITTAGSPVRDALPRFTAQRGGIDYSKDDLEFWESQFE